jgi:hypothetical protein
VFCVQRDPDIYLGQTDFLAIGAFIEANSLDQPCKTIKFPTKQLEHKECAYLQVAVALPLV